MITMLAGAPHMRNFDMTFAKSTTPVVFDMTFQSVDKVLGQKFAQAPWGIGGHQAD
jgi:hypothetical protein